MPFATSQFDRDRDFKVSCEISGFNYRFGGFLTFSMNIHPLAVASAVKYLWVGPLRGGKQFKRAYYNYLNNLLICYCCFSHSITLSSLFIALSYFTVLSYLQSNWVNSISVDALRGCYRLKIEVCLAPSVKADTQNTNTLLVIKLSREYYY